jgi:ribosomal protein S14
VRRHKERVNKRRPKQKALQVKAAAKCHWCGHLLNDRVNHEFQISREHLRDSRNRIVYACRTCNTEREHENWIPHVYILLGRRPPAAQVARLQQVYSHSCQACQ